MTQTVSTHKPIVDWLTVVALAAIAHSLAVTFHEGAHALACLAVGGDLQEYSALHVACDSPFSWQEKVVAGSAAIANLVVGTLVWMLLRRSRTRSSEIQFFLWLFMLLNWLSGTGYLMFSGIANVADWATVIAGWEPHWLWRVLMTVIGTMSFMFVVWLALQELAQIIGGDRTEQIGRATLLGLLSYGTAALVGLLAGLFHPAGFFSAPVIFGLIAVLGALSPLVWMMQWFRAKSFRKVLKPPLEIHRRWGAVIIAGIVVFLYAFVLGRTLYF